jgi:Salmonella virulence plasmid 65kDa B protein/FG-GAP-like repeat/Insecticide toxin TcdB middle/N-terminal region
MSRNLEFHFCLTSTLIAILDRRQCSKTRTEASALLITGGVMVLPRNATLHWRSFSKSLSGAATALSLAVSLFGVSTTRAAAQTMALPGKVAVSATGAANYNIPVVVPPGTAGMTPSLSLSYSSQSGNGLLGLGWALDGLASIVRCPQTIAQDAVAGSVNLDTNDRFCLDGQRLVAISGVYGADGTEYRTEIESFVRVIQHTTWFSEPWFEVHTKTGQIMWFGQSGDSQIIDSLVTRSWLLNRVTDTMGNYFTITYTDDNTNAQAYPSRIDYTANDSNLLSAYNSVQFVYASRPDIVPVYQQGRMARLMVRLTNVQTFSGTSLVADYRLAYEQSPGTQLSRMTSVTLCGGDGTCLPATTFAWANAPNGTFTLHTSTIGSFSQNYWTPIGGDFNGDGKTDFAFIGGTSLYVYLSNGDGTFTLHQSTIGNFGFPPTANWIPISGDFNGDGKTDFAFIGGTSLYVYLSNGDGTFTLHASSVSNYRLPPSAQWTPIVGDFNGDGRTDFAMIGGNNGNALNVYLSNGDGTFSLHASTLPIAYGGPPTGKYTPITGDFNGDGKTDFAFIAGYTDVYLSNGDGTFTFYETSNEGNYGFPPTANWTPISGDFNGDGKTDFAFIGGTSLHVLLSNGDGTFTPVVSTVGNYGSPPSAHWTPIGGDFNGDGRADFAMLSGTSLQVYLSNGDGTFSLNVTTVGNYGSPPSANWTLIGGDFNGDGTSDFAFASNGGTSLNVFLNNGPPGDRVTSIATGLGATTAITYQPLTNSCCYWKDTTSTYPTLDVQGPLFVVSRVDSPVPYLGTLSTIYGYAGAKADQSGRGFLGFRQVTAFDPQTNISLSTNYLQWFPLIGQVTSVYKYNSSVTLNETDNTYVFYYLNNGNAVYDVTSTPSAKSAPYTVVLRQSVAQSHDLDGSAMPTLTTTYTYDFFSNATQIVASTSDGFSKTTSNAYTNDTTKWFLGRLISSNATSTTP